MHRKNCRCFTCEIYKVINRSCEEGEHDLAGLLLNFADIFTDMILHRTRTHHPRDNSMAVAAKVLTKLILARPKDTENADNKKALSEVADLLASVRTSNSHGKGELGATVH